MKKVAKINSDKCPQNHPCPAVKICPVKALTQEGFNAPTIDESKCIGCGKCVMICGKSAFFFEN